MKITSVQLNDLPEILRIENLGFNPAEAGTRDQYQARIQHLKETFLVARTEDNTVTGFIVGPIIKAPYIEDWMYEADARSELTPGGTLMILTLAVDPVFQGQGIGSRLLGAIAQQAKQFKCQRIALTCLADRIPFYEHNGYQNMGRAASTHANETWYNLAKVL